MDPSMVNAPSSVTVRLPETMASQYGALTAYCLGTLGMSALGIGSERGGRFGNVTVFRGILKVFYPVCSAKLKGNAKTLSPDTLHKILQAKLIWDLFLTLR